MKKSILTAICVILAVIMVTSFAACDMLSGGSDKTTQSDDAAVNAENEKKEQEAAEAKEKADKKAAYEKLSSDLKTAFVEADSLDDYLAAVLNAIQQIPKEDIETAAGLAAGADAKKAVTDYYDQCVTAIDYVKTFLPEIKNIAEFIDENSGTLGTIGSIVGGLLGKDFNVKKNEDGSYTALGYTLFLDVNAEADESYRVLAKNGNTYELAYFSTTKYLTLVVTNADGDKTFDFECKPSDDLCVQPMDKNLEGGLYAQALDCKNDKLFQTYIDIDTLEATVSISNEDEEKPYTLEDGAPEGFATSGAVYTINKDMLADLAA